MTSGHLSERRSVKPGSQASLRRSNQQRIVRSLLQSGSLTQAELSRQTGLSTATVSNIVKAMVDRGLLATSPTTSSGRRALAVSLTGDDTLAAGIDIGRSHVRVVVTSINYRVVGERWVHLPLGHEADLALDVASTVLDEVLAECGSSRDALIGVGLGVPGPIDRRSHAVIDGTILPEWVGITVDHIQERLRMPVMLENDANLGAIAEITWGPHKGVDDLVFVKVGTGIGSGLILGGEIFPGNIGVSGEIGHLPIHEHGLICRCGNRGCLETVASTAIMIELLSREPQNVRTTSDIIALAQAGDKATLHVIDDAGRALGRALAAIANLVNPQMLVLGGPLAGLGEILLEPVRKGFVRYSSPVVHDSTELTMSSFTDRAEALGGAAIVIQEFEAVGFET
ncbi:ROK family transcriptional regulator [Herbiconiux daphne]|uniref:ROK family transcriptional regulator n=1 Tax=Herbiconiux daphne TaxID=2970914 RepID=A0ABT2H7I5_9MICO|nr:ROK family transcriptional regulator [Herbiconiux daphne]MCS5735864.1 ROK family transcriptional regulator [Herbiconiux daphne]